MIRRYLPQSVADLVHWYERYISPLSLVAGFLVDNFILLRRVDLLRSNALLLSYLVIAAVGIVLINMIEAGRLRPLQRIAPLIPVIIQFAFGGLFSGYLSLYSRSAGVVSSWVFVAVVVVLLIGNERFTRLYARVPFQIGIYFTVLFSFLIFFLPVVVHRIGDAMFLVSGGIALSIVVGLMYVLHKTVPRVERENRTRAARAVAIIYIVFNLLYFTNAIPPLPLALKDAGVYHGVMRESDGYHLMGEPAPWYSAIFPYHSTLHLTAAESAYVFTAIFAPTGLSTGVLHQWQRYDVSAKAWVTVSTTRFAVSGGREAGYRGYSVKSQLQPGDWRVNVITSYGKVLGRVSFSVVSADAVVPLTESVR